MNTITFYGNTSDTSLFSQVNTYSQVTLAPNNCGGLFAFVSKMIPDPLVGGLLKLNVKHIQFVDDHIMFTNDDGDDKESYHGFFVDSLESVDEIRKYVMSGFSQVIQCAVIAADQSMFDLNDNVFITIINNNILGPTIHACRIESDSKDERESKMITIEPSAIRLSGDELHVKETYDNVDSWYRFLLIDELSKDTLKECLL